MPHPKKKLYESLMMRMTKAIEAGFDLEASWYAYSIIEDRLVTALKASGGSDDTRGKPIRMLGPKIELIKKRARRDLLVNVYFVDSGLIDALVAWKRERDSLMHAMANARTPLAAIDKGAHLLASNGKVLVKSTCRYVRLLKNNRHKIAVPK